MNRARALMYPGPIDHALRSHYDDRILGPDNPPLKWQVASSAARDVAAREDHLERRLSPRQIGMIALGGAIGTGFFLGSGVSVRMAGPGVILAYLFAGFIAFVIALALAEMSVAHPVAGAFGVHAEIYLHPWAGFAMRYSYWLGQTIVIGSEVIAAAIYCDFWFPRVPGWLWVIVFSAGLLATNAWSVSSFGEFEYWFALIKVVTLALFLVLGAAMLLGVGPFEARGFANYTGHGGFLPRGLAGVLLAMGMVTFSFFGVEEVSITAGEARDPARSIPRATRSVFWRLGLFYIGGITVLVGLIPWTETGLDASPFVRAFQAVGLHAAPTLMNLVVLTAALSSANTNFYLTSRMLYSLARGGHAPASLGRLTSRGIPLWALLASSGGMAVAVVAQKYFPQQAYLSLVGAAFFGGLFVWMMILVTHLRFRHRHAALGQPRQTIQSAPSPERVWRVGDPAGAEGPAYPGPAAVGGHALPSPTGVGGQTPSALPVLLPGFPYVNWLALAGLTVAGISTWFVPGMRSTILAGLPWLAIVTLVYFLWHRR